MTIPPLSHDDTRSKLVSYIISAQKEIERLDKDLALLEPFLDYDILAYKKWKVKKGAKDAMLEQIQDCIEGLKSL